MTTKGETMKVFQVGDRFRHKFLDALGTVARPHSYGYFAVFDGDDQERFVSPVFMTILVTSVDPRDCLQAETRPVATRDPYLAHRTKLIDRLLRDGKAISSDADAESSVAEIILELDNWPTETPTNSARLLAGLASESPQSRVKPFPHVGRNFALRMPR